MFLICWSSGLDGLGVCGMRNWMWITLHYIYNVIINRQYSNEKNLNKQHKNKNERKKQTIKKHGLYFMKYSYSVYILNLSVLTKIEEENTQTQPSLTFEPSFGRSSHITHPLH